MDAESSIALLALLLAVTTLIVLAAFGLHIFNGGEYEMRTVIAMTLRSAVWIVIAIFARQYFKRHNNDDYT